MTAASSSATSNSPVETFTYLITPYAVWNSSQYASGLISTTHADIPMLAAPSTTPYLDGVDYTTATGSLTVTQAVTAGMALNTANEATDTNRKAEVMLPTYLSVGDYWYKVEENLGNTTGVFYGTNDGITTDTTKSNGDHSLHAYYVHVQVLDDGSGLVRGVTMHKTAPTGANDNAYNGGYGRLAADNGSYDTDDKVNAIENQYYAGELVVSKSVTGNGGDKTKYFPVTVRFTKPEGTVINSDITFSAPILSGSAYIDTAKTIKGQNSTLTGDNIVSWSLTNASDATSQATATVSFYVKDGTSVTFSNIPYGINYSVTETLTEGDGYQNKIEFSGADAANPKFNNITLTSDTNSSGFDTSLTKSAAGSISDLNDTLTITNKKELPIDVGVITENAPYVALVAVAAAGIILLAIRRKKAVED